MDIITSLYLNVLDEKLFLESPFLGDRFNNVIKSVVLGTMYSTVNFNFNSRVKKEFTHDGPSANTFLAVFARNFVNLTRKNRNANLDSPA